eukprot:TRINITY_DN19860_c0_g1_i2.p1 TRINITY_DN19860_c0_g1~~TRINITY_DN19860_c0_g1_i2.p1  ORF type:complete len:313 (-),score=15.37 TRINITY_DN19860_c0_g1_i2:461-1399(-)
MASHRLFWASLLMTIVLSSALTPSATKPTRPFARSSADDLSKRPLRELLTTDDTGAPLAPETLALLDRIDHVIATGEVKDVMDVALHFGKIFGPGNTAGAAAAGGVGSTAQVAAANGTSTTAEAKPTVEQMLRDFKRFSDALNRPIHLPKYGIIARIIKKIADNAVKNKNDMTSLAGHTFLIPSNTAFTNTLAKSINNLKVLIIIAAYNMINKTYSFGDFMLLPPRVSRIPTLIPGMPLARYVSIVGPIDVARLGGSPVALGRPKSFRLSWAEIRTPNLYNGRWIKAHGVSTFVKPNIKNFTNSPPPPPPSG